MIASTAAFALLLPTFLSCCFVSGEHSTATKFETESTRDAGKQTRTNLRLLRKEMVSVESSSIGTGDVETAWPTYTPTSFDETSPEFIATSFESGYMRDPTATEDTISISMETPWPTYFPTAFATRAPTVEVPTFGIASSSLNCDPVGSRPNNNNNKPAPAPTPTTISSTPADPAPTFSPVARPTPRPFVEREDPTVTFRRGDMLKKIERLGIKGEYGYCIMLFVR